MIPKSPRRSTSRIVRSASQTGARKYLLPACVLWFCLLWGPTGTANGATSGAQPGSQDSDLTSELVVLDQRAGEGEQCLVCRVAVHGDEVVELRYKGRTFHVRVDMLEAFENDPEAYFRSMQARSGLFDEMSVTETGKRGNNGWLYFGFYMLAGLVFGAICSALAVARAQPGLPWFFGGLLVNVVALIALMLSKPGDRSALPAGIPAGLRKVPTTRSPGACATCGAEVHPAAGRCSSCNADLVPSVQAETARV